MDRTGYQRSPVQTPYQVGHAKLSEHIQFTQTRHIETSPLSLFNFFCPEIETEILCTHLLYVITFMEQKVIF